VAEWQRASLPAPDKQPFTPHPQLEWAHLDEEYDEVVLGETDSKLKRVPIMSGRKPFADALKKEFPGKRFGVA
jgi:hypothetical protein